MKNEADWYNWQILQDSISFWVRKGAEMAYNEKIYKEYRSRVIKNVNFVNDIFYFTVLFGKWALQAWRANSLPINCSPHLRGLLPLRITSKWTSDALNLILVFLLCFYMPWKYYWILMTSAWLLSSKFVDGGASFSHLQQYFLVPLPHPWINYITNSFKSQCRKI